MSDTLADLRRQFYGTTQQELDALKTAIAAGKDFAGLTAGQWGGSASAVGARVSKSGQVIAAASTYTAFSFDTETYDYGGLWVVGSPTRLTIPAGQGGLWHIGHTVSAGQAFGAGKIIHGVIRKNGTDVPGTFISSDSSSNLWPNVANSVPIVLAAADYLETFGWQDQGTNISMSGSLWAFRVGSVA